MTKTYCDVCTRENSGAKFSVVLISEETGATNLEYKDVCYSCYREIANEIIKMKRGESE